MAFDDFGPEGLFRAFAPWFSALRADPSHARSAGVYPPVNLYDDGTAFYVRAEMPGIQKDSLEVTAKGDQLTIRGERAPFAVEGATWHRRECDCGQFARSVSLPQPIDADQVKATYKNGVLEVVLPRVAEVQPRRITVH